MSDYQIVRYKADRSTFEVLCKPATVPKYRKGNLGLDKVLFAEEIYTNASKGDKANANELKTVFDTEDVMECIKTILEKGEYQLSTAERREMTEKRKREVINYIHKYYTDPRSKIPHPLTRIELAYDKVRPNIDPFKPADQQAQDLVKKLVEHIPLKKSEVDATLKLKHQYVAQGMAIARKYGQVRSDQYDSYGCTMRIGIVPGDYESLIREMENVTKGDYDLQVEGAGIGEGGGASAEPAGGKKGKSWGGGKKGKGRK